MPQCLLDFVTHVVGYKAVLRKWADGDYRERRSTIGWPPEFDVYVRNSYAALKAEQMRLMHSPMYRVWRRLTGIRHGAPATIDVKGREITVPEAYDGVARFGFADLCEAPLGATDFLRIAETYHSVIIDGIPVIARERREVARRFINLVDTFYDRGVRLIVSAAAEPVEIFPHTDGEEALAFQRTASRLTEMRSEAWLSGTARKPGAS